MFVGYDTQEDFESFHGKMWRQIALMLTGLGQEQLRAFGGYRLYDPSSNTVIHEDRAVDDDES